MPGPSGIRTAGSTPAKGVMNSTGWSDPALGMRLGPELVMVWAGVSFIRNPFLKDWSVCDTTPAVRREHPLPGAMQYLPDPGRDVQNCPNSSDRDRIRSEDRAGSLSGCCDNSVRKAAYGGYCGRKPKKVKSEKIGAWSPVSRNRFPIESAFSESSGTMRAATILPVGTSGTISGAVDRNSDFSADAISFARVLNCLTSFRIIVLILLSRCDRDINLTVLRKTAGKNGKNLCNIASV